MDKSKNIATTVAVILLFAFSNINTVHAQQTVEDQYWDAVKNSKNTDDFKSYLQEYPNGKYAPIARLKSGQASVSVSFLSFTVSTAMTNRAFMEKWQTQMKTQLPIKLGEDEIYRASAPTSEENYFYTSVRTPNLKNVNIQTQANALKSKLLPDYCKSEAYQREITVVLGYTGAKSTYGEHLAPIDCSQNTTARKQTDTEYLNSWATDVRVDLPETIGGFELTNAWSRCPNGCTEKDSSAYLLLQFNALNVQKNAPIDQLKSSLQPLLLEEYCKLEAVSRKIKLGVFFENRGSQADYNNFWVYPEDCSKKTSQGKTVFITSQTFDGNLGGVAGANASCQSLAKSAGLSGTYKAWIGAKKSNSKSSPWSTFQRSTIPYIMTNGTQISANFASLISSNLDAKLDIDEYGQNQLSAGAWTGLSEGKTIESCKNWTSNDSGASGAHGCSSTKDSRWGRDNCGTNRCSAEYRLYCFQQ